MKLEQMTARISPRTAWQAIDLGFHAWRSWWKALITIWLSVSLLPAIIFLLVGYPHNLLWSVFLIWWLKPIWEKPLLAYCAHRLFDPDTTVKSVLTTFVKTIHKDLFATLVLRRLDLSRSVHMAISQLEKLRGSDYRQRVRDLGVGGSTHGGTLTVVTFMLEQWLSVAFLYTLMMLWPNQQDLNVIFNILNDENIGFVFDNFLLLIVLAIVSPLFCVLWLLAEVNAIPMFMLAFFTWYLCTCVFQPIYSSCGFSAYINRRTWLEAWDLQIGLRHLGERRKQARHQALPLAILIGCLAAFAITPDTALANDNSHAQQQAIELLSDKRMTPTEQRSGLRFKDLDWFDEADEPEEEDNDEKSWFEKFLEWLEQYLPEADENEETSSDLLKYIDTPAEFLRLILWLLVLTLILWIVWRYRDLIQQVISNQRPKKKRPIVSLAGMDIRKESLPDDIAGSAQQLLDADDQRGALALLYRGTLSTLVEHHHTVDLMPGNTEYECLKAFEKQLPNHSQVVFLKSLTSAWINCAWGHRPVSYEHAAQLITNWKQQFQAPLTDTEVMA